MVTPPTGRPRGRPKGTLTAKPVPKKLGRPSSLFKDLDRYQVALAEALKAHGYSRRKSLILSIVMFEAKLGDPVRRLRRKNGLTPGGLYLSSTIAIKPKRRLQPHKRATENPTGHIGFEARGKVLWDKAAKWKKKWRDNPNDFDAFTERDWMLGMQNLWAVSLPAIFKSSIPTDLAERHVRIWAPEIGESAFAENVLIPTLRGKIFSAN